jgi:hypothetical protein
VSLTPAIREFVIRLEDLLDRLEPPGLRRDGVAITTADAQALVRLPHVSDHARDVEIEIDDHRVIVGYPPERISFTSRDEALQFI